MAPFKNTYKLSPEELECANAIVRAVKKLGLQSCKTKDQLATLENIRGHVLHNTTLLQRLFLMHVLDYNVPNPLVYKDWFEAVKHIRHPLLHVPKPIMDVMCYRTRSYNIICRGCHKLFSVPDEIIKDMTETMSVPFYMCTCGELVEVHLNKFVLPNGTKGKILECSSEQCEFAKLVPMNEPMDTSCPDCGFILNTRKSK